jgi:adenosine 3'-phospho 5'-phosphosulfate transporter B3
MVMSQPEPHILGILVTSWPRWVILAVGAGGVFFCFLLHGIAHEHLIKGYHLNETFFLTFIQFIGYSALSLKTLFHVLSGKVQLKAPFFAYIATSLALALSMSLTNFAAIRLSYATGVLFKSSKLIPVMIGNIIFLKKKPKFHEVCSVILVVLGLIGISLGDLRSKNSFNLAGILAVSTALICGAIASNMEDKVMSQYGASQDELISVLYSFGALVMAILAFLTGQMPSGIGKVLSAPSSLFFIFCFSILGALGIQFVYLTMKVFGSLITVMITSVRKALTVCLSFIIFRDKVFTSIHAASILAIAVGIGGNVYGKTTMKSANDEAKLLQAEFQDEDMEQESAV